MGLFDKLKTSDSEEVELQPPAETALARERTQRERAATGTADDASSDGEEDEFILPGMSASAEASADEDRSTRTPTRSSEAASRDEMLERISEQNERIIELLEEIAGGDSDTSIW